MKRGASKNLYYFFSSEAGRGQTGGWRPNTDIFETATHVVVNLEVAGVRPEDISLVQHGDRLVVRGTRRPQAPPGIKGYQQIEIAWGEFGKEIVLSEQLKGAEVEATLALGVLSIRISKKAPQGAASERLIEIETDRE